MRAVAVCPPPRASVARGVSRLRRVAPGAVRASTVLGGSGLTGRLGMELRRLQLDDNVAAKSQMVEQHVEVEVLACNIQVNLMSNERKTDSQFEQESSDLFDERALQAALLHITGQFQKVEHVGVFERLRGQIGLRLRQRACEVVDGLAQPL